MENYISSSPVWVMCASEQTSFEWSIYKGFMVTLDLEKLLQGRSYYWLAQQTGLAHTTIGRLTKAKRISYVTLDKLCSVFKCEPWDLLVRDRSSAPPEPKQPL